MRKIQFGLAALVVACGGAPSPAPVTVGARPAPLAPVSAVPMKVDRPSDVVAWVHAESPRRIAALMERVSGPAATTASCAKGDVRACLDLVDPERPVDVAVVLSDSGSEVEASAFSVRSVEAFRTAAARDFDVKEARPGRLELVPKKAEPSPKAKKSVECDVSGAEAAQHRVVCGDARAVARTSAWLATSPEPANRDDLVRVEIFRGPLIAAADKRWSGDAEAHRDLRALAHDFDGATMTFTAGDDPGARADFDLDVRMRESRSTWTRVMLTPPAPGASTPDAFARIAADATAAFVLPGGGPLIALLDRLDAFSELAGPDPAKGKAAIDELRAVLGRPIACGYVVDFDAGRAALAKARSAPEKGRDKAQAALEAALSGEMICGVEEPVKDVEQLARKLVRLAPPSGDKYAVKPATGLGLPRGSFLVEATHPAAAAPPSPHGAKPPAPRIETTLAVPDGDTTWLVVETEDVRRAVRATTRMLAKPKAAAPAAKPGAIATGYVTTGLGAFFWDLAMRSYDKIDKTLATPLSTRMQIALSQRVAASGGAVSLHLSTEVGALATFADRAAVLALPIGIFFAAFFAHDDSP